METAEACQLASKIFRVESASLVSEKTTTSQPRLFFIKLKNDRTVVMKCYATTDFFQTELEGIKVAAQHGIPTPKVITVDFRHRIAYFEKLRGDDWTRILKEGSRSVKRKTAKQIGQILCQLHSIRKFNGISLRKTSLNELCFAEANHLRQNLGALRSEMGQERETIDVIRSLLSSLSTFLDSQFRTTTQTELSDLVVLHGDLWSGNIFVCGESGSPVPHFLDFEFAMIGERIIDLARVFSRGFVVRDPSILYSLEPDDDLWSAFADGYRLENRNIHEMPYYHVGLVFSLVRTVNYYVELLDKESTKETKIRYLNTILRMCRATLSVLEKVDAGSSSASLGNT